MSELAVKQMTLAEFLRWEDGTDTRYELLAGFPVAMAPPAPAHGLLAAQLCIRIGVALQFRRPCRSRRGSRGRIGTILATSQTSP